MPFKTIVAPHINVNDLEMKLVHWTINEWGQVKKGDPICDVETTKSIETIESTETGYLYPAIKEHEMVVIPMRDE